jgi:predicted RNase H-like HicB family nuclease
MTAAKPTKYMWNHKLGSQENWKCLNAVANKYLVNIQRTDDGHFIATVPEFADDWIGPGATAEEALEHARWYIRECLLNEPLLEAARK